MKAAVINRYGDNHEFRIQDVPLPEVDTHDVLIRVHAAGINPLDYKAREGDMKLILSGDFPKVLGAECAGVVKEVGLMVTDFQPGDRVVASLGPEGGGYAEFAVAKAKHVAKLPDEVEFAQAAAMPVAALTALQSLRDKGQLRPGDRVLINGASGGVGVFAVQIARILGGVVTAVTSTENLNLIARLGADRVIDYKITDFTQENEKYNLVFDAVGKSSFDDSEKVLTDDGVYVTTLPSASDLLQHVITKFTSRKAEAIVYKFNQEDMNYLLKFVANGELDVVIDKTYALEDIAKAHEYIEAGKTKGKLVIQMQPVIA